MKKLSTELAPRHGHVSNFCGVKTIRLEPDQPVGGIRDSICGDPPHPDWAPGSDVFRTPNVVKFQMGDDLPSGRLLAGIV